MQTLSNMRRNSSTKDIIKAIGIFIISYLYISLSSTSVWFPPLIGVGFVLFARFNRQERYYHFLAVIVLVFCIETERNMLPCALLGLYTVLFLFVLPRFGAVLSTARSERISDVLIVYMSLYVICACVDMMFDTNLHYNAWLFIYYALIEVCLVIFI